MWRSDMKTLLSSLMHSYATLVLDEIYIDRPRTSRKRWNFYETRRVAKDSEEVYEARSVLTIVVLLELQDAVLLPSVAKELILKKGGLVGDGIG